MKLNATHYDTCFPSYFCGHHAPYLQIPVYKGMTLKEIKQNLLSELNQGAIGGSSLDWKMKESERLHRAMRAAINRMKPTVKGQRTFFNELGEPEDYEDCADSVCAYFVFLDDYGRFFSIDFLGGE